MERISTELANFQFSLEHVKALAQANTQLRRVQEEQRPPETEGIVEELSEAPTEKREEVILEEESKDSSLEQEPEKLTEEKQDSGDSVEKIGKSWDQSESPMLLQDSTERANEES